jgi:hypothetical protein
MKRRSKAAGELTKGRRRKAPEPKRRNAPKPVSSSTPILETEVARLTRELNEAREQQTATSQVLQVISSFAGELDPVSKPSWRTPHASARPSTELYSFLPTARFSRLLPMALLLRLHSSA